MNKRHKDFNVYLMESLQNPKLAKAYLNEALADKDQRVFVIALKNILHSMGLELEVKPYKPR